MTLTCPSVYCLCICTEHHSPMRSAQQGLGSFKWKGIPCILRSISSVPIVLLLRPPSQPCRPEEFLTETHQGSDSSEDGELADFIPQLFLSLPSSTPCLLHDPPPSTSSPEDVSLPKEVSQFPTTLQVLSSACLDAASHLFLISTLHVLHQVYSEIKLH